MACDVPTPPLGSVTRQRIPSVSPCAMRGVHRLGSRDSVPKCEQRIAPSSLELWCKRPRRNAQQSFGLKTLSAGELGPHVVTASKTLREALKTSTAPENLGKSL